jgi:branched-chain amino acid aminotransferase
MLQKYNPKNDEILIWINGKLYPRYEAKVSVFDSIVQGGDGVWEGLRVYNGKVFSFDAHLNRLLASAKSLAFEHVPLKQKIRDAVFQTLKANGMRDNVHIRLTLTRGEKITSGMDPRLNQSGCTLIVLAEWKPPVYDNNGIRLCTANIRRNSPENLDSKIHHNNLLNNILAKIEANLAGADDAIMLDKNGYVAETNATNIFMIKNGELHTPTADYCLPGITRGLIIELCGKNKIPVFERNISIVEFYTADEVFVTGTMGELVSVKEIDGRKIENKSGNMVFDLLTQWFGELVEREGEAISG